MLIAPEEIESLLQLNGYSLTAFSAIRMPDIPAGNKRYLIFNKGVSDDLIDRINQAITTQIRLENTE
jgi:polar amino acid transport system substrate-binding protein